MLFEEAGISGVYIITSDHFTDNRGSLTKTFTNQAFAEKGLPTDFPESFFSVSKKNVIRGMHFQTSPTVCGKLVYVTSGAILDVVLDIRPDSPTYGQYVKVELTKENHKTIFIPEGCAHGFLSLLDNSCTVYMQTKMRDAEYEGGIRFDSFNMEWGIKDPIVSERDLNLPTFSEFKAKLL